MEKYNNPFLDAGHSLLETNKTVPASLILVDSNSNVTKFNQYLKDFTALEAFIPLLAVGYLIFKRYFLSKAPSLLEIIKKTSQKDTAINQALLDLRTGSFADAVVLGLFHNTSVYGLNYHLLKMTVLHESINKPSDSRIGRIKNVPLAHIVYELEDGRNKNWKYIVNVSDSQLPERCRIYLNSVDVSTRVNYALVYKDTPIAILGFIYKQEQTDVFSTIEQFEEVLKQRLSHPINYYLDRIINEIVKM